MTEEVLLVLCAGLGTLGFALFFHVRPNHLFLATLGGALSWVLYLVVREQTGSVFCSALVAAMGICFWAECFARLRKAPATIFLIPGIVPLLPGGALYYTMNAIISEDMVCMIQKAKETGMMVLGIVLGILVASEIVRVLQWLYFHRDKFVRQRTLPLPPSKKP